MTFKAMVGALIIFSTACTTEEDEQSLEAVAFSSSSAIPTPNVGGDETFYQFDLNNGKSNWSDNGKYKLGIVADEKVRKVYILAEGKHDSWQRVDPDFGAFGKGSFDVDAFLRNDSSCGLFNPDKSNLQAFAIGPLVYVVFGNKYATLRVDSGEVFREGGGCGNLPDGITCVDYLPFKRTNDFYGAGFFVGVTEDGYVAGSTEIDGEYSVPSGKSSSDVNMSPRTAGKVSCLEVQGYKFVRFTLNDGKTILGAAQRGKVEFIKVD